MSDETAAFEELKKQMRSGGGHGNARHPQAAGPKCVGDQGSDRGGRHAPGLVDQLRERDSAAVGPAAFHANYQAQMVLKQNGGLQGFARKGPRERNNGK